MTKKKPKKLTKKDHVHELLNMPLDDVATWLMTNNQSLTSEEITAVLLRLFYAVGVNCEEKP